MGRLSKAGGNVNKYVQTYTMGPGFDYKQSSEYKRQQDVSEVRGLIRGTCYYWNRMTSNMNLSSIMDKTYDFTINMFKGAAVFSINNQISSKDSMFKTCYNAMFQPDIFHTFGDRSALVRDLTHRIKSSTIHVGSRIQAFQPHKIYLAECSKVEFGRQYSVIFNETLEESPLLLSIGAIAFGAFKEEFIIRFLMQRVLGKFYIRGITRVCGTRDHDSFCQSKVVALSRILTAMAFYRFYFLSQDVILTDDKETIDWSFNGFLISNLALGIINETWGFGASFGARLLRDVVAFIPQYLNDC